MKTLQVIVSKANDGISAHLPEVDGYVIARKSVAQLKKDLRKGLQFHIEGLYKEERQAWMDREYDFEYVFQDIQAFVEAYSGVINQSSLARMSGLNESLMRQYTLGIKNPTKNTLIRIEQGLKEYSRYISRVRFQVPA
ncbi:hypothetical protein AGMMS4956_01900 [Bacteroidia bacterium]|nr:hypothetical protein AGMMS4956_01900 [Bacteroidia bacterium]